MKIHRNDLESASAYLTEQVQLFVISRDIRNMELYFEEASYQTQRKCNHFSMIVL